VSETRCIWQGTWSEKKCDAPACPRHGRGLESAHELVRLVADELRELAIADAFTPPDVFSRKV